jgi:copper chaperone
MTEFRIDDMTCNHCASTITKAVQSLDKSAKIEIDLAAKRVRVDSPVGPAELAAAIRDAGFTPANA